MSGSRKAKVERSRRGLHQTEAWHGLAALPSQGSLSSALDVKSVELVLVGVPFLCQTSYPVTSCMLKNWACLPSYHLSSQRDQDDGDNQTKYKQLAMEPLLIMPELLECLGEPGMLVPL